ncbi:MAG: histidine phosphatase family protein [Muribaculaceae bacterium]|nr:histidine phosphatase family protein [Muribaculaceae bacterium]
MITIRRLLSLIGITSCLCAMAIDPTETDYSYAECQGSLMPYPEISSRVEYPDSLEPVMINHVGRHGARYPASAANCMKLRAALHKADSLGTITPLGRELNALNERVIAAANGQWGALDSLGMAEQRGIATRMYKAFPHLFEGGTVNAISSYSPRVMMSMMSFTHQLDRLNNKPNYLTSTGRVNSPLVRPFDIDEDYIEFRKTDELKDAYKKYFDETCPTTAITRVLGKDFPYENADEWRDLAITEYYVIAGLSAMSMASDAEKYFTRKEFNALWSCFNLRQYLQRTASVLSTIPADITSALVLNIIQTTDNYIDGSNPYAVNLRFGHAETIMPLASLLHLPGCYYMTNYFDTVAQHWKDFYVVPMASNIQFILFKAKKSGRYYVRVDFNEVPTTLIPNNDAIYLPWGIARNYMMNCVPLYAQ